MFRRPQTTAPAPGTPTRYVAHTVLTALAIAFILPAHALPPDQIFDRVSPSIVMVLAADKKSYSQGSGVVIAPHYVITNCHVVEKYERLTVKWRDMQLPASLDAADTQRDLCQLYVPALPAPAVTTHRLSSVRVGQRVYAVGNPAGLELTFTEGLISAIRTIRGYQMIQTSAPVTHGSSGGGLFDDQGRMVGVTSSGIKEGLGLNFAIPVDYVQEIIARAKPAKPVVATISPNHTAAGSVDVAAVAPTQSTIATFPRVLNGSEIADHYQRYTKMNVSHKGSSFFLTVSSLKWINRVCPCSPPNIGGRMKIIPDKALVCFDWNGNTRYPAGGCYALMQTSEDRFALQDKDGIGMEYSVAR